MVRVFDWFQLKLREREMNSLDLQRQNKIHNLFSWWIKEYAFFLELFLRQSKYNFFHIYLLYLFWQQLKIKYIHISQMCMHRVKFITNYELIRLFAKTCLRWYKWVWELVDTLSGKYWSIRNGDRRGVLAHPSGTVCRGVVVATNPPRRSMPLLAGRQANATWRVLEGEVFDRLDSRKSGDESPTEDRWNSKKNLTSPNKTVYY